MPRPVWSILPPVAALALPLLAITLVTSGSPAQAAEECQAAPKGAPPQGSHWYYRTDRATGRKCWYLAEKNRKVQAATPRAAPREKPAEPAPQAQPAVPEPVAETQPIESLAPVKPPQLPPLPATTAGTPWPDPPTGTIERKVGATSLPVGQGDLTTGLPTSVRSVETPVRPVGVAESTAGFPTLAQMAMFLFLAGALVLLGLLTRVIVREVAARRRWAEFDRYHAHLGAEDSPPVRSKVDSPRGAMEFPPVPPMGTIRRHDHDDVEEALRRVQVRKRAA